MSRGVLAQCVTLITDENCKAAVHPFNAPLISSLVQLSASLSVYCHRLYSTPLLWSLLTRAWVCLHSSLLLTNRLALLCPRPARPVSAHTGPSSRFVPSLAWRAGPSAGRRYKHIQVETQELETFCNENCFNLEFKLKWTDVSPRKSCCQLKMSALLATLEKLYAGPCLLSAPGPKPALATQSCVQCLVPGNITDKMSASDWSSQWNTGLWLVRETGSLVRVRQLSPRQSVALLRARNNKQERGEPRLGSAYH